MDEAEHQKVLTETIKHYENKYQPKIDELMAENRRLSGKYNRLANKYDALRKSVSKNKNKNKQHFRNQTGGMKGVRR